MKQLVSVILQCLQQLGVLLVVVNWASHFTAVLASPVPGAPAGVVLSSNAVFSEQEKSVFATRTVAMVDFPPFAMMQAGVPTGVLPDFLAEVDARIGGHSGFAIVPMNRLRKLLLTGEADYTFLPAGRLVKGELAALANVGTARFIIWPRKGIRVERLADMQGLVYATYRNGFFAKVFDQEPLMEYMPVDNWQQGVGLLLGGRIDALAGAAGGVAYALKAAGVDYIQMGKPHVFDVGDVWLYLRPGKSLLTVDERFLSVLMQMRTENRLEVILKRYVDVSPVFQQGNSK